MARRNATFPILMHGGWVILLTLVVLVAPAAAVTITTDTGLDVTIHTPDEIVARWLVSENGRTWLRHPIAGEVELDTVEHPWDDLVPMDVDVVTAAAVAMQGFRSDLDVEIFVLPGFPAEVGSSFARRESVFLAPGLGAQADETVAYITTHELGHVLCWAAVDGRPDRWSAYRELRGLAEQLDLAGIAHAERNREIIAEDLRFLFGGPLATVSGTIENSTIPLPTRVSGLRELLVGYLADPNGGRVTVQASRVYPNPCRDVAVVELDLEDTADKALGGPVMLEIFDVRGRLVRRLSQDRVAAGRATVTWDGQGRDGRRAAAGIYLYRISHQDQTGSGRLLLLAR